MENCVRDCTEQLASLLSIERESLNRNKVVVHLSARKKCLFTGLFLFTIGTSEDKNRVYHVNKEARQFCGSLFVLFVLFVLFYIPSI